MASMIRAVSKMATRPLIERVLFARPAGINADTLSKRWAHNHPLTYDYARERILLVLRLFDKVDPERVTLESHFVHDLGLDSLDHVEIIMAFEDEFNFEIPDQDAEKLVTPGHILQYITDHEECYEHLQELERASHGHHALPLKNYSKIPLDHEWVEGGKFWKGGKSTLPKGYGSSGVDNHKGWRFKQSAEDEHPNHHDHEHHHEGDHHAETHHQQSIGHHQHNSPSNVQKRGFCTSARLLKKTNWDNIDLDKYADPGNRPKVFPTSFNEIPPEEVKIDDIQARVMKVCSNYDKIDSSKLDLSSHLVSDLGLDSLDHVEIMMELEDEFGLEIPDKDAEKLMRPAEMARYIFQKEEARALNVTERPF